MQKKHTRQQMFGSDSLHARQVKQVYKDRERHGFDGWGVGLNIKHIVEVTPFSDSVTVWQLSQIFPSHFPQLHFFQTLCWYCLTVICQYTRFCCEHITHSLNK